MPFSLHLKHSLDSFKGLCLSISVALSRGYFPHPLIKAHQMFSSVWMVIKPLSPYPQASPFV